MTTWKNHRIQIKTHAKISLIGNFLKGIIAAGLTLVASAFALYFLPIPVVSQDELAAVKTIDDLIRLFMPANLKVFVALAAIAFLLYMLLTAPLNIGKHKFYLLVVRGAKPKFSTVFSPFTDIAQIFRACSLAVISFVWQMVLSILLFAPSCALRIFSPLLGPLAEIGGYVLFVAAMFFFLLLCMPLMMAPFVLADNPECGAFKSILIAKKRLKGARIEFLVFNFSFTLWYLPLIANLPISLLIEPYITTSMAGFYETADACKVKVNI